VILGVVLVGAGVIVAIAGSAGAGTPLIVLGLFVGIVGGGFGSP